jgi:ribonuclease R
LARPTKITAPFPSPDQILAYIQGNLSKAGKREIARAFKLNAEQKKELKKVLREMEQTGTIEKNRGSKFSEPGKLPSVTVLEVTGPDKEGDLRAKPLNWDRDTDPVIFMQPERSGNPALGKGDRVLARLEETETGIYTAKSIRRISEAPDHVLGVLVKINGELRVQPTDRRKKGEMIVRIGDSIDAKVGELVRAEVLPGKRLGLRYAKITERLESMSAPGAISFIAIHQYDIPTEFPDDAKKIANNAKAQSLGQRSDLRHIPLITIDGADARDFDDAVFAELDEDKKNLGGWHLIVAIADVASYISTGDALDKEAQKRGNSVYFPDRVVPMLPEALSNGWCSLVPNEERPCLAVHLWIDKSGHLLRHSFVRGLMLSRARTTYEQIQAAQDGQPDELMAPLVDTIIAPLYGAFQVLDKYRQERSALELEVPERTVIIGEDGKVASITPHQRLDSHKLIEEFMITANVAAAQSLESNKKPCMYRIHDRPSPEKLGAFTEFLETLEYTFSKGQVIKPIQFNHILRKAANTPNSHMINQMVLRSQAQAEYSPINIGHFGLALSHYCHFTSPIRRYSDLLVHRALINANKLGNDGLQGDGNEFEELGAHLCSTERRAAKAERDAMDRYVAGHLSTRIGSIFNARVNGVTRFGLFVTLDETGADGLVPISSLAGDYYDLDKTGHILIGQNSGNIYQLGQAVEVVLREATPVSGGLIFQILISGEPRSGMTPQKHKCKSGGHRSAKKGAKGGPKYKKIQKNIKK